MADTAGRIAGAPPGPGAPPAAELVAAVRAADADEVGRLLYAGADPDTADTAGDGLPVLCRAIAAYDVEVAGALVEGGADPGRRLPDGTTPLRRAVESGSPAVVTRVLGRDPLPRIPAPERAGLLALAREWYGRVLAAPAGARADLCAQDDDFNRVGVLRLGGRTVRAGHGAVLTELERAFRVPVPVEELADRAVLVPDPDHTDWWAALYALTERRRDRATYTAVTGLRHHPDPAHRRFAADVLRCLTLFEEEGTEPSYAAESSALLAGWAEEETEPGVLADVLTAWTSEHDHPAMAATGLRYAGHPAPEVRAAVPGCLAGAPPGPRIRVAVLALARDPDARVRRAVCEALGGDDDAPETRAALRALAGDPDREVRWAAAERLAESADRGPEAADTLAALAGEDRQLVRIIAATA